MARDRTVSANQECYSDAERTDISRVSSSYLKKQLSKPKYEEPTSARIEDFENQMKIVVTSPNSTARSVEPRRQMNGKQVESDMEYLQSGDFQNDYRKSPVSELRKSVDSDVEKAKNDELERKYQEYRKELEKGKKVVASLRPPQAPRRNREPVRSFDKQRGYETASEIDTARTDDLIYAGNHVIGANVHHTSYLNGYDYADSDVLDTVRTDDVRHKFKVAMANSKTRAYSPSEISEEDVDDRDYRDYIARKSTENARLSRVASACDLDQQQEDNHVEEFEDARDHIEDPQPVQYRDIISPLQFYDHDDATSMDEDCKQQASEIHRESRRIAQEMAGERRKRLLWQHQQEARVAKSTERSQPDVKSKSSGRRQAPVRSARSLDRLASPQPEVVNQDKVPVAKIEKAVVAKEIKEKLFELQFLADTVDKAKGEKRLLIKKLRGLRSEYSGCQDDVKIAHMNSWDCKQKADKLKNEVTLLEFKRSQVQHELDETAKTLSAKKEEVGDLNDHIKENQDRLKDFEELGMTAEEIKEIMHAKNNLESVVNKQEAVGEERDLLNDRLQETKEELFEADKRNRTRVQNLEERIDDLNRQNQDLHTDKSYLQQQLKMLEEKHNKEMLEKDSSIQDKEVDFDNLQENLQAELNDLREEASTDTARLKHEIEEFKRKTLELQAELNAKNEENSNLKEQVLDLETDFSKEVELREKEALEHKNEVARLEADSDASSNEIRQRLFAEKHTELQEAYGLFSQERNQLAAKLESKLSEQLAFHHEELMGRDDENLALREQAHVAEENARKAEEKAQREAQTQLEADLEAARLKWQEESERIRKAELVKITDESVRAIHQAKEDAERERAVCQHLETQIDIFKHELQEVRHENRQSYQDKLDVISRLKESHRDEREAAVDNARAVAIDEGNREIEKLRVELEMRDEVIERMRSDAEASQQKESENQTISEKHDRTVVHEINEDCKKTSLILGVKPRKMTTRSRDASPARSSVHAALANLHACNEQLRAFVQELKQEIDSQRAVLFSVQREKEEALGVQKEKLLGEKNEEMNMLKERLIKDHMEELLRLQERSPDKVMTKALVSKDAELKEIQKNMNVWKEEVAEKFAKKFEEELSRELEKRTRDNKRSIREKERMVAQQQRDIERLECEMVRLQAATPTKSVDSDTIELLRHLQERLKELRAENSELKKKSTTVRPTIGNYGCSSCNCVLGCPK